MKLAQLKKLDRSKSYLLKDAIYMDALKGLGKQYKLKVPAFNNISKERKLLVNPKLINFSKVQYNEKYRKMLELNEQMTSEQTLTNSTERRKENENQANPAIC